MSNRTGCKFRITLPTIPKKNYSIILFFQNGRARPGSVIIDNSFPVVAADLKILIFIFFDLIVFTSEGKVKPGIPFFQGNRPVNLFRKPAIPFVLFIKITDDTVFPALSDFEKAIVLR